MVGICVTSGVNPSNALPYPVQMLAAYPGSQIYHHNFNLKPSKRTTRGGESNMRDLAQSGKDNLAACLAMIVLTAIMIMARFAIRLSQWQRPLGADWLCLLSFIPFCANCGIILQCEYSWRTFG